MKMNWTRFVAVVLLTFGVTASVAQDIRIYTADNQGGKINPDGVEKAFTDAGFYITGRNNMNIPFDAKYKKHPHELYYLMTLHKKGLDNKLAKKYTEIA